MATFKNGKLAGESLQVTAMAGYVVGGLLNGIARLAGKGVAGATATIASRRQEDLLDRHEDMRVSNDSLCVEIVGNYVDNCLKEAMNFLNSTYDDSLKTKTSVSSDLWNEFYESLYLQSFKDLAEIRAWHGRLHQTMVEHSSDIMRGDVTFMRQNWLNPSMARLQVVIAAMSHRYEVLDKKAKDCGYTTKPFRQAIVTLYVCGHETVVELRDSMEREMNDQIVDRKFLNELSSRG